MIRHLLAVSAAAFMAAHGMVDNPEEYVNTNAGTENTIVSNGNALPIVSRPWGFNSWIPQNRNYEGYSWWDGFWYDSRRPRLFGVRCSHQASPWVHDWGFFLVSSFLGGGRFTEFGVVVEENTYKPYEFSSDLYGMENSNPIGSISVTAESHAAIFKFVYPTYEETESGGWDQRRRVIIRIFEGDSFDNRETYTFYSVAEDSNRKIVKARNRRHNNSVPVANFVEHILMEFDQPISDHTIEANEDWVWLTIIFDTSIDVVEMEIATSLINTDQVAINLQEVHGMGYDALRDASKAAWNEHLKTVTLDEIGTDYTVQEQEDIYTIFYTALYRASLFPRSLVETDAGGRRRHYSPYHPDGGVFDGESSTDSGFWDAYHTVYPLLGLVFPHRLVEILNGYLTAYDEGGWVPQWATIGYKASMVSTMSDASFADAIVKQSVSNSDVNYERLYEAARKNAYDTSNFDDEGNEELPSAGRKGLHEYVEFGYIPYESTIANEVVSRSLNYYHADWSLAQAAHALAASKDSGRKLRKRGAQKTPRTGCDLGSGVCRELDTEFESYEKDAEELGNCASCLFSLFDENQTKFFRPKDAQGIWLEPFDQYLWGPLYTEAGPWQFRFHACFDPQGYAEHFGSRTAVCDALHEMVTVRPIAHTNHETSHEMNSLFHDKLGQYAHSNQPVHHVLYMFFAVEGSDGSVSENCSDRGVEHVKTVLHNLYTPTSYAGDEDNGEMSAWYLLSSMGLYTMCPGTDHYNVGGALFRKVTIHRADGKTLEVSSTGNCKTCHRIQGKTINGSPITDHTVTHQSLFANAVNQLDFAYSG